VPGGRIKIREFYFPLYFPPFRPASIFATSIFVIGIIA